jgi:hypothetical protein
MSLRTPPPTWRRPRRPLDPGEVSRLVGMRRQGATWKEIGRAFGKQDGACKLIYDRAVAGEATRA